MWCVTLGRDSIFGPKSFDNGPPSSTFTYPCSTQSEHSRPIRTAKEIEQITSTIPSYKNNKSPELYCLHSGAVLQLHTWRLPILTTCFNTVTLHCFTGSTEACSRTESKIFFWQLQALSSHFKTLCTDASLSLPHYNSISVLQYQLRKYIYLQLEAKPSTKLWC